MDLSYALQFKVAGEDLFRHRLVTSHSGNISVRIGERMLITRHGCSLSRLSHADLVETGLVAEDLVDPLASVEVAVHRAIYRMTDAGAIVHAHPAHAIVLSFNAREIVPADTEGSVLLGRVPVVGGGERLLPGQGAELVANALKGNRAVVVHGHGCFAKGRDLEEACQYAVTLEESCRIQYLLGNMRG